MARTHACAHAHAHGGWLARHRTIEKMSAPISWLTAVMASIMNPRGDERNVHTLCGATTAGGSRQDVLTRPVDTSDQNPQSLSISPNQQSAVPGSPGDVRVSCACCARGRTDVRRLNNIGSAPVLSADICSYYLLATV